MLTLNNYISPKKHETSSPITLQLVVIFQKAAAFNINHKSIYKTVNLQLEHTFNLKNQTLINNNIWNTTESSLNKDITSTIQW